MTLSGYEWSQATYQHLQLIHNLDNLTIRTRTLTLSAAVAISKVTAQAISLLLSNPREVHNAAFVALASIASICELVLYNVDDDCCWQLLQLSGLVKLTIVTSPAFTGSGFCEGRGNALQELTLVDCMNISAASLQVVVEAFPFMLVISFHSLVSDRKFNVLQPKSEALQVLAQGSKFATCCGTMKTTLIKCI